MCISKLPLKFPKTLTLISIYGILKNRIKSSYHTTRGKKVNKTEKKPNIIKGTFPEGTEQVWRFHKTEKGVYLSPLKKGYCDDIFVVPSIKYIPIIGNDSRKNFPDIPVGGYFIFAPKNWTCKEGDCNVRGRLKVFLNGDFVRMATNEEVRLMMRRPTPQAQVVYINTKFTAGELCSWGHKFKYMFLRDFDGILPGIKKKFRLNVEQKGLDIMEGDVWKVEISSWHTTKKDDRGNITVYLNGTLLSLMEKRDVEKKPTIVYSLPPEKPERGKHGYYDAKTHRRNHGDPWV